jgi:hypothetical protein
MAEVSSNFGSEHPPSTSGVNGPILDVLWVAPHQIAEGAFVRDLNPSVDGPDLIDCLDLWAQPPVDAHDLPVDYGAQWQVVEHFRAVLPGVRVPVFPVDLVEEPIHLGNLPE